MSRTITPKIVRLRDGRAVVTVACDMLPWLVNKTPRWPTARSVMSIPGVRWRRLRRGAPGAIIRHHRA